MSEKPNLKLIVNNKFSVRREAENEVHMVLDDVHKINWWSTLTWHSKTQIFVFAILIGSIVSATFFHTRGDWYIATAMWMLSFLCMFLIWTLEYRLRIDSDPFDRPL